MGCKDNLMRFIVLGALVVGVAFGIWVTSSCKYLESNTGNLEVGIYHYSLDLDGSQYDTNGECTKYGSKAADGYVRTAQVCAVMAPVFGLVLLVSIPIQQFCCNIPCSGILVSLCYVGAQICTALIWLIYKAPACSSGCDWGDAATGNIIAQMMYLIAAIFHKCMPTARESAALREANAEKKNAEEAEAKQKEAEDRALAAEAKLAAVEANSPTSSPTTTPAVTGVGN